MNPPVVSTSLGQLRGVQEGTLAVFRGVPYAAAPIGGQRWQPAQVHPGWEGVRDAGEYGATAPQPYIPGGHPLLGEHGSPPFGEDCLTLNIWTPGLDDARRPVVVWIHGGGFLIGSGNIPYYAGDTFARDGDLVVSTINYRLGPLGFMEGVGESSNLWLSDQATALRWIADNIASFGGDPRAIVLIGQSGGGLSIGGLAQHPLSRGLFGRAIVQSAPLGYPLPTRAEALERTRMLARLLGHSNVEGLRQEPAERLIEGTVALIQHYAEFGEWNLAFSPVLDEVTMPRSAAEALAEPNIDLLIGWTKDEATFPFAFNPDPRYADVTRSQVVEWLGKRYQDPEAMYDAYVGPGRDVSPLRVMSAALGDAMFRREGFRLVERRAPSAPVYAYQFDLESPAFGGTLGATHCLDLPFTFAAADRWTREGFLQGFDPSVVDRVSRAMHRAWIAFVRTGDPSQDALAWRPYTVEHRELMVIGQEPRAVSDPDLPPADRGLTAR